VREGTKRARRPEGCYGSLRGSVVAELILADSYTKEEKCTYNNEERSCNHCCSGKAISIT
jgi:hypothetical protein